MGVTPQNLTDDDGSGTTGSVWNHAWQVGFEAAIDAAIAAASDTVVTTTSTGTQANFAPGLAVRTLVRCNNATLLTITGLAGGVDGQTVTFVSIGAGQVNLSHQAAGSTAANRLINFATVGDTPLAAGSGTAMYKYDGTTARWRLIAHEQGAFITPTYAAGNFTTDAGTWTVDSGDVLSYKYRLSGRSLTLTARLDTTTVATSPTQLRVAIPGGFINSAGAIQDAALVLDNAAALADAGVAAIVAAGTYVAVFLKTFGAWAASTNNTGVRFTLTFEVQ